MALKQLLLRYRGAFMTLLVFAVILALMLSGLGSARQSQKEEAARVLYDSLRRAAISCYAIEGRYPESLEYLTENYDVYIDTDEYAVFYSVFATNIMPDITIIEK